MYHRHRNPFGTEGTGTGPGGSGSFPSSLTTSAPMWMGDYATIGVQVYTASAVTILGSDRNGWYSGSSLIAGDFSVLTVLPASAGLYKVEPGFEWAIFVRNSSVNTVFYTGQSRK